MNDNVDDTITRGSGNVFEDLGLPDPKERLLKSRLAGKIFDEIESRGWTQAHAADALGLSQPDVSRLTRGVLKGFSVERLMTLLVALDYNVSVRIEGNGRATEEIDLAGSA
ncbi:MAG: helix-turn-helix transcriptional regulator [Trueperaceae bacterium]